MSRVTITDLVVGSTAASADVNATLASWNTALGAAAIGANNVRPEGLDRRSLSAGIAAVYSGNRGTDLLFDSSGTSGAVSSVGVWTGISLGGVPVRVGPTSASYQGAFLLTGAIQLDGANGTLIALTIQQSTDLVSWTNVSISHQYRVKAGIVNAPRCIGYYLQHYLETAQVAYYYRIAFQTSGLGTVIFNNGTLYAENFAK